MPLLTATTVLALLLATGHAAVAHGVAAPLAPAVDWAFDPSIVIPLVVATGWYAIGLIRMRGRDGTARVIRRHEVAAFASGIAVLVAALVSPLHEVSEQLLSAHMVQHLLLMFVAAPLLAVGRPVIVCLWALPPSGRKRTARLWATLGMKGLMRMLMHPLIVWILFCGSFIVWHLPRLYELALRDEGIHTLEHLCFFVTALMFWSLVIEPSGHRRFGYGATLLLIAHTAILSGLPGALIALAPRPIYPAYAAGAAAWGMTLMEDQQLAGVIMWVPAGVVYLVAACVVFLRWMSEAERQSRSLLRQAAPLAIVVVLPVMLLSGCGRENTQPQVMASGGGNKERGARLIGSYQCGTCHTIPGIENADGLVGPPLMKMRDRIYIAGMLRNTPANLMAWIEHPQNVVPGNAMPDMGINEHDARDVVAYLDSLH